MLSPLQPRPDGTDAPTPSRRGLLLTAGLLGALAATSMTGCGLRIDDLAPYPTPTPDASEQARAAVAAHLDRARSNALAISADAELGAHPDNPKLIAHLDALAAAVGGQYFDANDPAAAAAPSPTLAPSSLTGREAVTELSSALADAFSAVVAGLHDFTGQMRPAMVDAAAGSSVVATWFAGRYTDAGASDPGLWTIGEDGPLPRTQSSADPTPTASALGELVDYAYGMSYGYERTVAVSLRGEQQSRTRDRMSEVDVLVERARALIAADGGTPPDPRPAYAFGRAGSADAAVQEAVSLENGLAEALAGVLSSESASDGPSGVAIEQSAQWFIDSARFVQALTNTTEPLRLVVVLARPTEGS